MKSSLRGGRTAGGVDPELGSVPFSTQPCSMGAGQRALPFSTQPCSKQASARGFAPPNLWFATLSHQVLAQRREPRKKPHRW